MIPPQYVNAIVPNNLINDKYAEKNPHNISATEILEFFSHSIAISEHQRICRPFGYDDVCIIGKEYIICDSNDKYSLLES